MDNLCVCCGKVIPEGRMVCPMCEQKEMRLGAILQSNNATEEEVKNAYNYLEEELKKKSDRGELI